jgi:hypothetical protein
MEERAAKRLRSGVEDTDDGDASSCSHVFGLGPQHYLSKVVERTGKFCTTPDKISIRLSEEHAQHVQLACQAACIILGCRTGDKKVAFRNPCTFSVSQMQTWIQFLLNESGYLVIMPTRFDGASIEHFDADTRVMVKASPVYHFVEASSIQGLLHRLNGEPGGGGSGSGSIEWLQQLDISWGRQVPLSSSCGGAPLKLCVHLSMEPLLDSMRTLVFSRPGLDPDSRLGFARLMDTLQKASDVVIESSSFDSHARQPKEDSSRTKPGTAHTHASSKPHRRTLLSEAMRSACQRFYVLQEKRLAATAPPDSPDVRTGEHAAASTTAADSGMDCALQTRRPGFVLLRGCL